MSVANPGESAGRLKVRLVKSAIGHPQDQKATIKALGLRKLNSEVFHKDSSAIRGMLRKVSHLVTVEEVR